MDRHSLISTSLICDEHHLRSSPLVDCVCARVPCILAYYIEIILMKKKQGSFYILLHIQPFYSFHGWHFAAHLSESSINEYSNVSESIICWYYAEKLFHQTIIKKNSREQSVQSLWCDTLSCCLHTYKHLWQSYVQFKLFVCKDRCVYYTTGLPNGNGISHTVYCILHYMYVKKVGHVFT